MISDKSDDDNISSGDDSDLELPLNGAVFTKHWMKSLDFIYIHELPIQLQGNSIKSWENIPAFAVLTGINGVGKTGILLYIHSTTNFGMLCTSENANKEEVFCFRKVKEFVRTLNSNNKLYKINQAFKEIDVPYSFNLDGTINKNGIAYGYNMLSGGERYFLFLVLNTYITSEFGMLTLDGRFNKPLLFDEPDAKFDPKLCKAFIYFLKNIIVKNGFQVIMTTHRIDTIALAPVGLIFPHDQSVRAQKGEIFTVKKVDKIIEIESCHKLLAMFRLTANLREFTNHHHKVYTESRKDALFYEGVHKELMKYSNNIRLDPARAQWQEQGTILDNLLSRRFQLSFMSVSDNGDGGGNSGKVIEYIAKDITAFRNLETVTVSNFYDRIQLHAPYGIVDYDYGKKHDFARIYNAESSNSLDSTKQENNRERVVILKRHSLENYICDPFVLSSVVDVLKKIDKSIFKDKDKILPILENINNNIENIKLLKRDFQSFYKLLILNSKNHVESKLKISKDKKGLQEGREKEIYEKILEKIAVFEYELDYPAFIYNEPQKILINGRIIEFYYPGEVLHIQGHALAEILFGKKDNVDRIIPNIVKKIYQDGLKYIPLDLVKTMFELNQNVRMHVREVLKPDRQKLKWSDKLVQLNSANSYNMEDDQNSALPIVEAADPNPLPNNNVHQSDYSHKLLIGSFIFKELIEAGPIIKYFFKEILPISPILPDHKYNHYIKYIDNNYIFLLVHYIACNIGVYSIAGRIDLTGSSLPTTIYAGKLLTYEYLNQQKQLVMQNAADTSIDNPAEFINKCGLDMIIPALLSFSSNVVNEILFGVPSTIALYDMSISAVVGGVQCYNLHNQDNNVLQNQLSSPTERLAPYLADLITATTILRYYGSSPNFNSINGQMIAIKKSIALIGSVVAIDYISKIAVNTIPDEWKAPVDQFFEWIYNKLYGTNDQNEIEMNGTISGYPDSNEL